MQTPWWVRFDLDTPLRSLEFHACMYQLKQSSNVTAHFTPTDPRHAIEESDGVAVGDRASAGVNEKADDSW